MAITQTRMLELIAAGEAWAKAWQEIADALTLNLMFYRKGDISEMELFATLDGIARATMPNPLKVGVLEAEKRYYETNAKRNEAAKNRAAGMRRLSGATPHRANIGGGISDPNSDMPNAADFANAEFLTKMKAHRDGQALRDRWEKERKEEELQRKIEARSVPSPDHANRIEKNPELKDINLAPPPDLSDLFK